MDPSGRKWGRAPLGDVSNCQDQGSRNLKLQKERVRNAAMSDEQKNERNKKRREAYLCLHIYKY
ncbi:hypothetical protein PVAP13_9NG207865 [Panicum virgatum]|uniref:Uncharacterized protein n=1 Tax=Panicum virgatum TaxID=38727 RepID=A0A8T0MI03_PANVG|nr:hypothetical protein PVAP13_9NG207865 [Panicum virgatum]